MNMHMWYRHVENRACPVCKAPAHIACTLHELPVRRGRRHHLRRITAARHKHLSVVA